MPTIKRIALVGTFICGWCIGLTGTSQAQGDLVGQCQALLLEDFSGVTDAPTQITSVTYVDKADDRVAHCLVEGYVTPTIGIEVRLPADNWNGKFIKRGCGAYCGTMESVWWDCTNHVNDGYACVVSDMGHRSTLGDAKWAYNNPNLEIDFGYRATHVATVAGKAITEAFYGNAPQHSYYMGCSTGGRQGMVEAQRFPWDFDGIIAGAPVINETGAGMRLIWTTAGNLDENREQILTASEIPLLYDAAIAKCDGYDGDFDGIIDDPRNCDFDPDQLQCSASNGDDCLTDTQVDVARKIYSGPQTSDGESLYTGGAMPGSELDWVGNYISTTGEPGRYYFMIGDMFRYMGFLPDPGPSWQPEDFDFDRDYKRLGMMEGMYSGSNPDLRKFRDAGGKLLVYHGWADYSVIPLNTVDYYELATRTMGGTEAIQEFFRLFMIPGMSHCSGGAGAYAIDYLSYMEEWVEQGRPPDVLTGYHPEEQTDRFGTDFPLDPDKIEFSREVYPYPTPAR
ncbi:MAG: tannase/feruloyl esterase family alpha/beta hydrolase [Rhodospirillaceae bacterium]|nr:tannase/feruloyl esterase family alpha/beta hydrolase [Rhodospirillaceae bacterium]